MTIYHTTKTKRQKFEMRRSSGRQEIINMYDELGRKLNKSNYAALNKNFTSACNTIKSKAAIKNPTKVERIWIQRINILRNRFNLTNQ